MMLPLQKILNKYNIHPKGVIVVGAHWAEEHDEFLKCGIKRFVYIEPSKEAFRKMVRTAFGFEFPENILPEEMYKGGNPFIINYSGGIGHINIIPFNVACSDKEEDIKMYVSNQNQGQSNSILKPKLHTQQHPEIIFDDVEVVKTIRLDSLPIDKREYDFLYMDAQGAEGLVLKGAIDTLKNINIIYSEINRGQTYEENMEIDEMDLFLDFHGFTRVETHWPSPNWTWGDAVFIRKTLFQ